MWGSQKLRWRQPPSNCSSESVNSMWTAAVSTCQPTLWTSGCHHSYYMNIWGLVLSHCGHWHRVSLSSNGQSPQRLHVNTWVLSFDASYIKTSIKSLIWSPSRVSSLWSQVQVESQIFDLKSKSQVFGIKSEIFLSSKFRSSKSWFESKSSLKSWVQVLTLYISLL